MSENITQRDSQKERVGPVSISNEREEGEVDIEGITEVFHEGRKEKVLMEKIYSLVKRVENPPDGLAGKIEYLKDKFQGSKFVRVALIATNMITASPAFASEDLDVSSVGTRDVTEKVSEGYAELQTTLARHFPGLSSSRIEQIKVIYANASPDVRQKIMRAANNVSVSKDEESADSTTLALQQQVRDFQEMGEVGPLREGGGTILPFDEKHSGTHDGVEYSNYNLRGKNGMQPITLDSANETQIVEWLRYMEKSSGDARTLDEYTDELRKQA
jgi:hypothetical protein